MKKIFILFVMLALSSCAAKRSFEAEAIWQTCNDVVADSCIITLPGDTTTTHFTKAAFGESGVYMLSDLPLSNPRMRIFINDIIRTRYFTDFAYLGKYENLYLYGLAYEDFPNMSRYEYDLMSRCEIDYYNGIGTIFDWTATFTPKDEYSYSFEKWFEKAIPYMLL